MPEAIRAESAGSRPGRPRDPEIDKRAIQAALAIYSDHGMAKLSFDLVARSASVGKAALYSRWNNVDQLLIDGLRTIAPPPTLEDFGSLRRDLRQLILMVWDLYSGEYGRVTFRILLDASASPALRPYYDEFVTAYVAAARDIVERGVRRGELTAAADPALLLEQLFGATMLHVLFFSDRGHRLPVAAAASFGDRLVDRILAGLLDAV
ncbi:TetR/AcrR family transcriptional regulator [Nocardia rhamnosiphila]|uniref:TetR/AcrR family transcriptional regulator n=1 Tax=Nocardia rhamnosiphila TaxID=426716 RepID=A0ABV2WRC1_9NOCA